MKAKEGITIESMYDLKPLQDLLGPWKGKMLATTYNVFTVEDAKNLTDEQILKVRSIGKMALQKIRNAPISKYGIAPIKGCKCHWCGTYYKMDLMISDELWHKITVPGRMLCPTCIVKAVEDSKGFSAFKLIEL
jgi:hypothetical protein